MPVATLPSSARGAESESAASIACESPSVPSVSAITAPIGNRLRPSPSRCAIAPGNANAIADRKHREPDPDSHHLEAEPRGVRVDERREMADAIRQPPGEEHDPGCDRDARASASRTRATVTTRARR